jgi:hypothetical protein
MPNTASTNESLAHQIRQRMDYGAFFAEFLPSLRGRGNERSALCIFHENTDTPALSVNIRDGLFVCYNPECGARGDVFQFYMRVRDMTFREAIEELATRYGIPIERDGQRGDSGVIEEGIVEGAHARLLASESMMEWLGTRRGFSRETVQRWQLGHDGRRYFIPIRDEVGRVVNIRRYDPNARQSNFKMISWREGYGGARIWPFESIERAATGAPILLLEGEMDTLLALQLGFNALTVTGGAGTWRSEWNTMLAGRDVWVCYDIDAAGRAGALRIAHELSRIARSVKIINLPITEPENADFTDYIVSHGHTAEDFYTLVARTPNFQAAEEEPAPPADREPSTLHLSQASRAEHYNQPVRFNVMVSGKTTAPYLVPKTVRLSCVMPGLRMCERCPVAQRAGNLTHSLDYETNEILQFTGVPDAQVNRLLKSSIGVPARCTYVDTEVAESINVEEVQLIPEIERTDVEAPYVTRQAFYVGHGLQANRSYVMTGLTVPEPRKQLATHIIHSAVPSQSNIDAFRMTAEVTDQLRAFQPERPGVEGLWEHLDRIYEDLERHTRIYQRRDLMLALDMVLHSVLSFELQGDRLVRGWCEGLALGDSRTGKTTIVQRMVEHYGAGEFSSGENTSLAGLIGGLHQIGTSWVLQWGRIPLNDRRAIVIDEAGNLPLDQIARLSSMRSSGIAEVIKVHTERTNARTRQFWISNPRRPMPLSSYSQGVLAVKELIGAPEDIARFDLVVTAASGDVELGVINAQRERERPGTFTSSLCHQRVMWAWSRQADHITFTPRAITHLLQRATEQGHRYRYATEIPLVEPNEQRVKLARLAVASAILFFSHAEGDCERVMVTHDHVEFAYQFLERLYAKPSLAFREYAEAQSARFELTASDSIALIVRRAPGAAQQLMEQEQLTQRDLQEILAYNDRNELRNAMTALRTGGFLRRVGTSYYVKTQAAIQWLRREIAHANGNGNGASELNRGSLSAMLPLPNDLPTIPDF